MKRDIPKPVKPLPSVGQYIVLDYGPRNVNTWRFPARVLAVVATTYPSFVLVVVERRKQSGELFWEIIDQDRWELLRFRTARPSEVTW